MFDLMHPSRGGAAARAERGVPSDRVAVTVCDLWLGSNGYAGMKALRRLGWVVHTAPEWEFVPVQWRSLPMRALGRLIRPLAVREFNARLVSLARSTRASMVVVFKGSFVTGQALDALRAREIKSYCFYPDNSFQAHGPYIPSALPKYDWVFTAKSFGIRDLKDQLGSTLVQHQSAAGRDMKCAARDLVVVGRSGATLAQDRDVDCRGNDGAHVLLALGGPPLQGRPQRRRASHPVPLGSPHP